MGEVGQSFPASTTNPRCYGTLVATAKEIFSDDVYLATSLLRGIDDRAWLGHLVDLSQKFNVPLLATGDVLYHTPDRMLLQDCSPRFSSGVTIEEVASYRPDNSQRHLRSLSDITKLYEGGAAAAALSNTVEISEQLEFRLDHLRYEYPTEWAPEGVSPIEYLKRLAWSGAKQRYPEGVPEKIIAMLRYELKIIEDLKYEPYFLTCGIWCGSLALEISSAKDVAQRQIPPFAFALVSQALTRVNSICCLSDSSVANETKRRI